MNLALEEFSSDAIRLWILQSHYRTNPLLDKKLIGDAERSMRRIRQAVDALPVVSEKSLDPKPFKRRFLEAMDDDLNTPKALAAIFDLCRKMNRTRSDGNNVSDAADLVRELTGVLGFNLANPPKAATSLSDSEVCALVQKRKDARAEKRWGDADAVRDQLDAAGISITDTSFETVWTRK